MPNYSMPGKVHFNQKFKGFSQEFLSFATKFIIDEQRSWSNLSGYISGGQTKLDELRAIYPELKALFDHYTDRKLKERELKKLRNSYSAV